MRFARSGRSSAAVVPRGATHSLSIRLVALLLLIVQLGVIAHRIEHYLVPEQMESGEDACAAFAPTPGAAPGLDIVAPVVLIVFFLTFWSVCNCAVSRPGDRLGFRAHAPPP
jgi:hypothetical protein